MTSGGDAGEQKEEKPASLSGAARASPLATAGYFAVTLGHAWLATVHSQNTNTGGVFFACLAVVEVTLGFEAMVLGIGGCSRSLGLSLLTLMGRLRLLCTAIAWPFLSPWAVELSCRCNAISQHTGRHLSHLTMHAALATGGFFILREVAFMIQGEPPSARGSSAQSQLGDCLPSQAVLGGQFRLDKADLEQAGRAVFVPARPRSGLYIGSGLAMLFHIIIGFALGGVNAAPPWLLAGALIALLGRRCQEVKKVFLRSEDGKGSAVGDNIWLREWPRLICRFGELIWIWFCILELQRCETSGQWLAEC